MTDQGFIQGYDGINTSTPRAFLAALAEQNGGEAELQFGGEGVYVLRRPACDGLIAVTIVTGYDAVLLAPVTEDGRTVGAVILRKNRWMAEFGPQCPAALRLFALDAVERIAGWHSAPLPLVVRDVPEAG